MAYKWRPSATQRKEFAIKMQNDPEYAKAYNERKRKREEKRRAESKYDYNSAGGYYIPTREQHDAAWELLDNTMDSDIQDSCNQVIFGYTCKEKIFHDHIHVINEFRRKRAI